MQDERVKETARIQELRALTALLTYARERAADLGENRLAAATEHARLIARERVRSAGGGDMRRNEFRTVETADPDVQ